MHNFTCNFKLKENTNKQSLISTNNFLKVPKFKQNRQSIRKQCNVLSTALKRNFSVNQWFLRKKFIH